MAFEPLQIKQASAGPTPSFLPLGATPTKGAIDPTFKASLGGAKTIVPNTLKSLGNVPSNAANLAGQALFKPAENIVNSGVALGDIFKNRGVKGFQDIGAGVADVATKVFKAPGQLAVGNSDQAELVKKFEPIQKETLAIKDNLVNAIQKGRKEGKDVSNLTKALQGLVGNQQQSESLVGTAESRAAKPVNELTSAAKFPIENPLEVPLAIYAGPNKEGQDLISRIASPLTRGADTSVGGALNKVGGATANLIKGRQASAVDTLEETYTELSSGTTPGKKKVSKFIQKTDAQNMSGTEGRTPMRVLAEEGITPRRQGTKLDTFEQAQEYRQNVKPLRDANRLALEEISSSIAPPRLDDLERLAINEARTAKNVDAGRFTKMEREIQSRFADLKKSYPEGRVPLTKVDDIKSAHWDNVFKNKAVVEADSLAKDADYAIAKALQREIETVAAQAGHVEVAQLNREIGDRLGAAKFLEELNGKTIKGGRLLKYLTSAIGSSMGKTLPGKIIGAIGGNLVGELIIASNVSSPVKRLLLRNLARKDPEAYIKTIEWLRKQKLDRETRLLLPEGPIIMKDPNQFNPDGSIKQAKAQVTEAQKNPLTANPQSGKFQTSFNSQSKSPTAQQTNAATKSVANMIKTIPQKK